MQFNNIFNRELWWCIFVGQPATCFFSTGFCLIAENRFCALNKWWGVTIYRVTIYRNTKRQLCIVDSDNTYCV